MAVKHAARIYRNRKMKRQKEFTMWLKCWKSLPILDLSKSEYANFTRVWLANHIVVNEFSVNIYI